MTPIRIEAENMSLSNYRIESAGGSASGGRLISLYNTPAGPTGTASLAFAGPTGTYDVVIGYYDENDGVASLDVRVGGTSLSKWQLDQNLGSGSVSGKTLVRRTIASQVSVSQGAMIEIQGAADQGEWARVDYIEFIPVATASPPAPPPPATSGSLAFSAPQFRVNEDGTPVAVVTVTRTGGSAGAVSATVNLSDGTAIASTDYDGTSIVVNFADGDTVAKTVTIPIVNDALVEGSETINLKLDNVTGGATIGTQSTAVLEIVDNDQPSPPPPGSLAFGAPRFSVNEDGTSIAVVSVTRTGGSAGAVSATVNLSDDTATAPGDYRNTSVVVNFADGDATTKTVIIPITDDALVEGTETVNLGLVNPTGGVTIGTQSTAVLEIVDNDQALPPQTPIRIEAENMSLSNYRIESAGGSASGGRLISLYNAPAGPTGTASLAFAGSTGTYDVVIGYYDENDGVASLDVRVGGTSLSKWQLDQNLGSGSVSGRTLVRRTVAGGVSLTNGSLIEIQGAADQGEWARVDYIEFIPIATAPPPPSSVPGSLAFSAPQFRVNEDGTPVAVVTVTRTGGSAGAVSATVSLSNGTATAPGDYRNTSVVVNFADGDATTKTVVIPITDDALVEGTETVNLGLVNPTGGATIGTQSTAVLEIIDNDNQPIRVEAENMTLANYRVQLGSSFASNGAFISLNGGTTTEMGSASYTFTGSSGTYDVVLGYYDETDGISHLEVYKQGVSLDVRDLNQNRGNAQAGPQTLVPRTIATGLTINQGETITISAIENQGEPAGVDYIEFIPVPSSTINGTDAAETLIGDGLNNIINGFAGNDTLIGKAGNDGLYGGDGIDTASYVQATQGVIANLSSGVVFTPLYSTTLKTMPLGDSITYGVINSNSDTESGGYRTYLWDKFVADSLSVDFVGSMSNGPVSLGDKNHEGHRGWMIQDIANNIDGWLDTYKPDVIPLMIGTNNTNDVVSGNTIADRLGTLIDQIASRSPNTQLLVASIPPVDGSILTNERAQRTAEFNLALPNLVKSKVAQGKKVTFVDMRSELTLSDLAEGLHPNGDGYRKISDYWYDAIIKNSFDKDTLSSIENLVGSAFNDKLVGNAGVNTLEGGAGKDILTGGGSTDTFVYKNPIEGSDTITDFSSDDILHISASGFGGGLSAGTALSRTASTTGVFVSSANPTSIGTSANFLYNTSTGLLNFDRDGTGSGAVTAIAMLSGAPALDINQFTIIS